MRHSLGGGLGALREGSGLGGNGTPGAKGSGTSGGGSGGNSRGQGGGGLAALELPVVMGSLDPDLIRRVIQANRAQIRYCYEQALQQDPHLEGRVLMYWVIAANGTVQSVRAQQSSLHRSDVEQCLCDKIKHWKFPEPLGGGIVEVHYPFVFKAN